MKLELKLGNIHCAGCASALEEILSNVGGVEKCSLNFISNILTLEIQNKNHKTEIMMKIILIIFCVISVLENLMYFSLKPAISKITPIIPNSK